MKFIIPIILIASVGGLFFGYIDPTYERTKDVREEITKFDDALAKSNELIAVRDRLLSRYNAFSTEELDRVNKLLPDNIDNVRLIIDIDSIAAAYGMFMRDVRVSEAAEASAAGGGARSIIGPEGALYRFVTLGFSVTASYRDLKLFLKDLEQSLRIVDVVDLTFSATPADSNEYRINVHTYWLP